MALVIKACAYCRVSIEYDEGEWRHLGTGWRMCEPKAVPLTFAEPHPLELPVQAVPADIAGRPLAETVRDERWTESES